MTSSNGNNRGHRHRQMNALEGHTFNALRPTEQDDQRPHVLLMVLWAACRCRDSVNANSDGISTETTNANGNLYR